MKRCWPLLFASLAVTAAAAQDLPGFGPARSSAQQSMPSLPGQMSSQDLATQQGLAMQQRAAMQAATSTAAPQTVPSQPNTPLQSFPLPPAAQPQQMAMAQPFAPLPLQQTAPQHIEADTKGKCKVARPGDIVHFELTIERLDGAQAVFANLEMSQFGEDTSSRDLPYPDLRRFGGGSAATPDAKAGDVFHFTMRVPEVYSGTYHGSGVLVTLGENAYSERARRVDVTHHTYREVHAYCLTVLSPMGSDGRALVTNFKGGPVERK